MTDEEVTECVAVAQCLIEAIMEDPLWFLGLVLDLPDASQSTINFLSQYFAGLLDIIRGTE